MTDLDPHAQRLLRGATTDLTSDVDSLVRGGIARGRTRRRRRRVGSALAAAAVVGVTGVAAGVAPGVLGSDGSASPDVAGSSASDPDPTVAPPVGSDEPRALAVRAVDVPAAFASLFPGEISGLPNREVSDEAPVIDFRWNGFATRVGITPSEPVYGDTPAEQCATSGPGNGECRALPDGTWVQALESTGPAVDGGISSVFVTAWTPDGWTVSVVSHNAASSKAGPVLADTPPFTVAQLEEAATNGVWFDADLVPTAAPEAPVPPTPQIAVKARQIPALVTAVAPGDVVPYEPYGGYVDAGSDVVAHFQLDGYLVSAGISEASGDPVAKCRQSARGTDGACEERPDGSVLFTVEDQGPAADGAVSRRVAALFRDGFYISVSAYNAVAAKDSAVLTAEPPLTSADLESIVTGPGWVD